MLDILTPKGQKTLVQVRDAISIFKRNFPRYDIITTHESDPAAVDFLIHDNKNVIATAEIKCRNMILDELKKSFDNTWLITFEKIENGLTITRLIKRPFYGFLYLPIEKKLLTIQITNKDGDIIAPMKLDYTRTQKTINGGDIFRTNAYIDMKEAKILS